MSETRVRATKDPSKNIILGLSIEVSGMGTEVLGLVSMDRSPNIGVLDLASLIPRFAMMDPDGLSPGL